MSKKDDDDFLAQYKEAMGSNSSDEDSDDDYEEDLDEDSDEDSEDDSDEDSEDDSDTVKEFNVKKAVLIVFLIIAVIWGLAIMQNPDYFNISEIFKPSDNIQSWWATQGTPNYDGGQTNQQQSWWGSQEQTPNYGGSQDNQSASWWYSQGASKTYEDVPTNPQDSWWLSQ